MRKPNRNGNMIDIRLNQTCGHCDCQLRRIELESEFDGVFLQENARLSVATARQMAFQIRHDEMRVSSHSSNFSGDVTRAHGGGVAPSAFRAVKACCGTRHRVRSIQQTAALAID